MSEGAKVVACMALVFGVPLIVVWELMQWAWPFVRAWLHAVTG